MSLYQSRYTGWVLEHALLLYQNTVGSVFYIVSHAVLSKLLEVSVSLTTGHY